MYSLQTINKQKIINIAFCVFVSFFILLWISPDSYLMHIGAFRSDSAWFHTCGRAWMEGMTPYVDFADSKGILLWLIYGVGYLLSPSSCYGVFWLSVVAYTVTFYNILRISRMFLDQSQSWYVIVVMPFFLFTCVCYNELRAEDFCYPAVFAGIYYTCLVLRNPSTAVLRKSAFWLGVAMMWCLLIKWTIFLMMGGMALVVAGVSLHRKSSVGIFYGLLGMAVMALPFAIYFIVAGNFGAFIQEYFLNTFSTTKSSDVQIFSLGRIVFCIFTLGAIFLLSLFGLKTKGFDKVCLFILSALWLLSFIIYCIVEGKLGLQLQCLLTSHPSVRDSFNANSHIYYILTIYITIVYAGILLFCKRFNISYWLMFVYFPFYLFLMFAGIHNYYFMIAMPFYIFFVICIIGHIPERICIKQNTTHIFAIASVLILATFVNISSRRLCFVQNKSADDFERVMRIIARKDYPKIIFFGEEFYEGSLARALPGCKYWAEQANSSEDMINDREKAVRQRRPDFVVVRGDKKNIDKLLVKSGYRPLCAYIVILYHGFVEKNMLYAK